MMHTPLGFYLLLGAAFSWVGLLTYVGLRRRARSHAIAEADRNHMAAVASLLAELVDQAGELGLSGEIVQDAREFQDLVAEVLAGGAALSVQEARDLSNFLHDLTLALASHEPSFSPGAPVSRLDFDGPSHMVV